jgi:hypothetical protein
MSTYDETLSFYWVSILAIISGETIRRKDGLDVMTKTAKERLRKNILANFGQFMPHLQPEIFCHSGEHSAKESIDLFIDLLARGINGKNIMTDRSLFYKKTTATLAIADLVSKAGNYAKSGRFDWQWHKKIRAEHWLKAGGPEVWPIKKNAEKTLFELANYLVSLPKENREPVAVIASHSRLMNLLLYLNNNDLPPLGPGDIVHYRFMYDHNAQFISIAPRLFKAA